MTTITINAAATLAGTTPRNIKLLICRGAFATVEAGDRVLIKREAFTAWLVAGGMQMVEILNRAEDQRRAAFRAQRARQVGSA